jgi:large subunit ribosomal protein L18
MSLNKEAARKRRKIRIRKKVNGTAERPRLVIFRSNAHLYVQLVDDVAGNTVAAASTLALNRAGGALKSNKDSAVKVGQEIARLAKEKNIEAVVFDRNGYIYHGRIKALADGAREAGLKF